MGAKSTNRIWYLALVGLGALILVSGLITLQPFGPPLTWVIRGAALVGYLTVFLTIISSAYMRELVRIFDRPFIRVHHILAVTGLFLVTFHPLGVALNNATLLVFLPKLDSLKVFLQLGGRPAWYLILAASLAALLRKTLIKKGWRTIHFLNYIAFWLATVHAIMIGTDFQYIIMKVLAVVMAVVILGVFIQKRRKRR